MYIAITKQHQGNNFKGSVSDFVDYLEKENEDKSMELQEHFFDQYNDKVSPGEVIAGIDGNTAKLSKKKPKFYSLVVSPSQRELKHIHNSPEKLRHYTRERVYDKFPKSDFFISLGTKTNGYKSTGSSNFRETF